MVTAAILAGTKWVERPPNDDDEGCYSLAEYVFRDDGCCSWSLVEEDGTESDGTGNWLVSDTSVVVNLTTLRQREMDGEWHIMEPQKREVPVQVFPTLFERDPS